MEFESGAVRSNDANDFAYYLISPIGLSRLAKVYGSTTNEKKLTFEKHLNQTLMHTNSYFHGCRKEDHLALACFHIFEAIRIIDNENQNWYNDESTPYRYDLISKAGLRHLASTYKEGSIKYGSYNVELGMPVHDLLNHAVKHINDYLEKDQHEEDDLGHASWGYIMSMHSEELWPELNLKHLRSENCQLSQHIKAELAEFRKTKALVKS